MVWPHSGFWLYHTPYYTLYSTKHDRTTPLEPTLELTILFGFSKTSDSSDSDFETLLMIYGFGISRLHFTDWSFFGLSWPRFRPITQFRFFIANVVYKRYSFSSVEIFKSESKYSCIFAYISFDFALIFCKFTHFWVILLLYSDIFPPKIPTVNRTELELGLKHTRSTVFNLITCFLFRYKLQIVSFFYTSLSSV